LGSVLFFVSISLGCAAIGILIMRALWRTMVNTFRNDDE
jgi:hypothetical protein